MSLPTMVAATARTPLLEARNVHVRFKGRHGIVEAVRGVSLRLHAGEVLAIVGESGSGKSTLARALMGMVALQQGQLHLGGQSLPASAGERPPAQRQKIGMVFQDSTASFNPRFTVARILAEPLALMHPGRGAATAVPALLDAVGLPPAVLTRRPHELSGGQRQRVGIARALAGEPQLLICDEAVSALDVSIQAQILNLLVDLQQSRGLALLFITHDLSVVSYLADRIAVMHRGRFVEEGDRDQVLDTPTDDYTRRLLSAGL